MSAFFSVFRCCVFKELSTQEENLPILHDTSLIENLPDPIFNLIFSYLSFSEIIKLTRVCHKWKTMIEIFYGSEIMFAKKVFYHILSQDTPSCGQNDLNYPWTGYLHQIYFTENKKWKLKSIFYSRKPNQFSYPCAAYILEKVTIREDHIPPITSHYGRPPNLYYFMRDRISVFKYIRGVQFDFSIIDTKEFDKLTNVLEFVLGLLRKKNQTDYFICSQKV